MDSLEGAEIHYTQDGSDPTDKSATFDPAYLLSIGGPYEGTRGLRTGYTIRAVATLAGVSSTIRTFQFTVDRRNRDVYVAEEIRPDVFMIRDSDNDKMFLVRGIERCVLIDSGLGTGNLRAFLQPYLRGRSLQVIFTHYHGDHTGQADQFISDTDEYIGSLDREALATLLRSRGVSARDVDERLKPALNGQRFDLGGRVLVVYAAPGHTPGSLIISDQTNGDVYSGDSFGSNSPTIPDAVWLQGQVTSLDHYLAMLKRVRTAIGKPIASIMTGHNDMPLQGDQYLDNLENALQSLMDRGDAALAPSLRPSGLLQIQVGDRYTDPNWVSVNVNKEHYLPANIDQIGTLTQVKMTGAVLDVDFSPDIYDYSATAPEGTRQVSVSVASTSTRARWIQFNGRSIGAHLSYKLSLTEIRRTNLEIRVCAPDGVTVHTYRIAINHGH